MESTDRLVFKYRLCSLRPTKKEDNCEWYRTLQKMNNVYICMAKEICVIRKRKKRNLSAGRGSAEHFWRRLPQL